MRPLVARLLARDAQHGERRRQRRRTVLGEKTCGKLQGGLGAFVMSIGANSSSRRAGRHELGMSRLLFTR
jgi:hypothetical protein